MSITATIKEELSQLGIKPKKSLGQNFLVNEEVYKKIITAVKADKKETILEIGPGLGTLTKYLSETEADIVAIEKDRNLISHLNNKFSSQKNVKIIEGDILELDVKTLGLKDGEYKVVGNIPYYITSHLLKVIFENWPKPKTVTLMMQKEVAQRIKAKPPEMSLLAVSVQYFSKPEIISYVSKGNFYPSPDVDSAIIQLTPNGISDSETFQKQFFKVVKAGFAGKRKQLINNLSRGLSLEKNEIEKKLTSIDISPQRRAETLTIEEWLKITKTFYSQD